MWSLVGIILVVTVAGCVLVVYLGQAWSDLQSALRSRDYFAEQCSKERDRADAAEAKLAEVRRVLGVEE